jgi:hypothetical protein
MKDKKPFWERKINPITGYYCESWTLTPDELQDVNLKKRRLKNGSLDYYE